MARCMLCSSTVPAMAVTCPLCGGAVEEDADATTVTDPTSSDPTHVHGVDLHKPSEAESAWPGEGPPPGGPFAPRQGPPPGAWGLPPGGQYGPISGYGPPPAYGAPPGSVPPPGYGVGPMPGYGTAPGYGYGPPWPGYIRSIPFDGLAIASFVTSLVGLVTALGIGITILACPVGAVLGHVARRRMAQAEFRGDGFALAGIIIGWIGTALMVIVLAVVFLWLNGWY